MSEVGVRIAGRVATITIDRPGSRNAIGLATIGQLGQALDEVAAADCSVLVLRGAGDRAFISGGDLKELSAIRDEAGAIAMASRMRQLLDRLSTFPLPVIAAVNGHALGGGAEVAVACDIRLAASDVRIGFTQVKLAIMPAWGGAERLAELVGRSRAMLLVATGRTVEIHEALRLGLVDEVAERAEFDEASARLADEFAQLSPEAARSIKRVIASARPHDHPHLQEAAVRSFAGLWVADAHWDAAAALR
ncbi:MAG TPA: enoyl-CoA hydratase/isomerase family protein [Sporichthyaceae bacterium]|jgi:enoyl-CoA hydratase/carnithine racemase|nr:enoyl-CoA hydratase/isomerase family protein [Sporichthyaceae bacterium]